MRRSSKNSGFRARLAIWIVGLSLTAITAISVMVVMMALPEDRARASQLVFSSVLPLFGTWVGTVLAFYFARENFEAATRSTLSISSQHRHDDAVVEVMIARAQMVVHAGRSGEDLGATSLESIATIVKVTGKKRVPILDDKGSAKYIIHQSLLDSYARTVSESDHASARLDDLLSDPENRRLAEAVAFIPITATLGEARDQMHYVNGCNDIFVTASGNPSEPVLGWLTDNLLATIQ
ncbi:hypothetical protein AB0H71_17005 [Nocardia sp. NPDC050697]|uniref:hypothetical protein n=1 Tax=Nocardia sp. NPDC050697 TaxID=3155158 RepID=UPI0033C9AAD5